MFERLQALFDAIATRVENNDAPFSRYVQLFFAILAVRLALEFYSGNRLFRLEDILHIGLWFTFIVLAFLIQLHLYSGVTILRTARLSITFFSIALSAPLIDLMIYGGYGVKMNYLMLSSWSQVVWSYITIGGSSISRGATPGIRIEIFLLVVACFQYVRLRRRRLVAGVLAAWSIYTVLFLSGAVPALLGALVKAWSLPYQQGDKSTLLLLLTADLLLLSACLYRHAPKSVNALLRAVPKGAVALALVLGGVGGWMARRGYPGNWEWTPTTLFWFPLLAWMALFFALLRGLQRGNRERNEAYYRQSNVLLLLILIVGIGLSPQMFFSAALLWALLFILYEEPLQLERVAVFRPLLEGAVWPAVALLGYVALGAPMVGFPGYGILWMWAGGIGISTYLRYRRNLHVEDP